MLKNLKEENREQAEMILEIMKSIEDVVKKAQEDLKPLNEILENEMILLCEALEWDRSKPCILKKIKKGEEYKYILIDTKPNPQGGR